MEAEAAAAAAEAARQAQEAEDAEKARIAEEARLAEDAARLAREAEEARAAEERAAREAEEARAAEEAARLAAEARAAEDREAARQAEEAAAQARAERDAAEDAARAEAEAARLAEEAAAAEAQAAEQVQALETAKANVAAALDAPQAAALLGAEDIAEEPAKKPGLFGRLLGRTEKKTVIRRELDDDMLEALEELLIASDMGVDTALRVTANMAEGRFGKKLSTAEIKELLAREIATIMDPVAKPMPLYPKRPQVVLVVGVNGSGKTTTIGKLALQFSQAGKKVVIAAGDTFRAAAVEQLQVWGERAGVPVLTAPEGTDPASLAFDAMTKAEADGADLLMIDTAGRLQNRADLMEELAKIVRVIRKKDETAPHNTLLVLDATTGQNALNQVDVFQNISDVSGLVMTKLDGTAKGGVLVALADKFGLPIHAIGVGEQIDDLAPFDPEEFAQALTGATTS
ncbi:MAG: signal recognition particle-docking protein FtsY [Pseudomonadota bacterium]